MANAPYYSRLHFTVVNAVPLFCADSFAVRKGHEFLGKFIFLRHCDEMRGRFEWFIYS